MDNLKDQLAHLDPVVQDRINTIIMEMNEAIQSLEEDGADDDYITKQIDMFQARIEDEVDMAMKHDNSSANAERDAKTRSDFGNDAKRMDILAAEEELQARIQRLVMQSQREVRLIRDRGEPERFVQEEEAKLTAAVDRLINEHASLKLFHSGLNAKYPNSNTEPLIFDTVKKVIDIEHGLYDKGSPSLTDQLAHLDPVVQDRINTIIMEMNEAIQSLEEDGADDDYITKQIDMFQARIEDEVDMAMKHDNSSANAERDAKTRSDFGNDAKRMDILAAEEELQARIQRLVMQSQREVRLIRDRGEPERFVQEEEAKLTAAVDRLIHAHVDAVRASNDPSAFRNLSDSVRAENELSVDWVESQFVRDHVESTTDGFARLAEAEERHNAAYAMFSELFHLVSPLDDDEKLALRLEKQQQRQHEKQRLEQIKYAEKQDRKAARIAELRAKRLLEYEANRKQRQLNRLQASLLDLKTLHPSATKEVVDKAFNTSSESQAQRAREVAVQARQRMIARRNGDAKMT